jgi:hypothetical protein
MNVVLCVLRHDFTFKQTQQLKGIFGKDAMFIRYNKTIDKKYYAEFCNYCKKFHAVVAVLPDDLLSYLVKHDILVVRPEFSGTRGNRSFRGWFIVEKFDYKTRPAIKL